MYVLSPQVLTVTGNQVVGGAVAAAALHCVATVGEEKERKIPRAEFISLLEIYSYVRAV